MDSQKIGQINAVIYATEKVMSHPQIDKGTELVVKEYAYEQIKQIMAGKCPWQEEGAE